MVTTSTRGARARYGATRAMRPLRKAAMFPCMVDLAPNWFTGLPSRTALAGDRLRLIDAQRRAMARAAGSLLFERSPWEEYHDVSESLCALVVSMSACRQPAIEEDEHGRMETYR